MAHLGRGVRLLVCAAVLQLLPASAVHAEGTTGTGRWSAPTTLSSCPGTGTPQAVFPSDKPTRGTGPGAIVWGVSLPCPGGAGVRVAAIGPEDIPGPPAEPRTAAGAAIALRGPVAATAGPYGRVVIAAASAASPTAPAGRLLLTEGPAGGPFAAPIAAGGAAAPFAFTTAYLGDVALLSLGGVQGAPHGATLQPGGSEWGRRAATGAHDARRRQRSRRRRVVARPAPPRRPLRRAPPGDRRARSVDPNADGRAGLPQRSARGVGAARLRLRPRAAGHGRPARRPAARGGGARRSRFRRADRGCAERRRPRDRRLERSSRRSDQRVPVPLAGRRALWQPAAARKLPRPAWPARLRRLAPARAPVLRERDDRPGRAPKTVTGSCARRRSTWAAWAPRARSPLPAATRCSPLWLPGPTTRRSRCGPNRSRRPRGRTWAGRRSSPRGESTPTPTRTIFAAGEQVAPPGPNSDATVAFDPDSDRAVAVWRTGAGAGAGAVDYSIRAPGAPGG